MKFIYSTDLHGDETKYNNIIDFAIKENIKLINLGADLLPKGSDMLSKQKKFINGFLKQFYQTSKENQIDVLAFFGNDDAYTRKKYFRKFGSLLDETPFEKDGYTFKAYPFVQDYPFGLKDGCKKDSPYWKFTEEYLGNPVTVTDNGFEVIYNVDEYFERKGSIEEDLKKFKVDNKTFFCFHQPPSSVGLDVCYGGRKVGSLAVYEFIEKNKNIPICFFGHIHESPIVSGIWQAKIGNTLVIQPGQSVYATTFVLVEISEDEIKTELIQI